MLHVFVPGGDGGLFDGFILSWGICCCSPSVEDPFLPFLWAMKVGDVPSRAPVVSSTLKILTEFPYHLDILK